MYKTILIPLDGSKLAEMALPHAEALGKTFGAELILLSVVEPPTFSLTNPSPSELQLFQDTVQSLYSEAEQYLKGKSGEFTAINIDSRAIVKQGPVVETIVSTAGEKAVDLMVLASHGRSGLEKVFFGSTASGVLNRWEGPLMLIRHSDA